MISIPNDLILGKLKIAQAVKIGKETKFQKQQIQFLL